MKLEIATTLNVFTILGVITIIIASVTAKHLPIHHVDDFSGETLTLNERFFDDVRALIKRRLTENAAIKKLHLESDNNVINVKEISSPSNFDVIPSGPAYVPTPVLVENWPASSNSFGQVTAVSVDPQGNPVIFHRADRYWDANSFNESHIYYMIEYGPIQEKTICILDPKTGSIKSGWGEDLFYMPHGMTIDVHGSYWITDVAMHQAFKTPAECNAFSGPLRPLSTFFVSNWIVLLF